MRTTVLLALPALLLAATSCKDDDDDAPAPTPPAQQNIVQLAQANAGLTALVAAVVKTGLAGTLSDANANFTVFAPTDAAFAALPDPFKTAASISAITDQAIIDALRNILLYHAAAARVFSTDLTNNQT
ncbi:MAG: fasciclin domain-containing protein [Hymenobacteraceae bacterium]|nr:fasciclin domain-containing protein [Hymenobacteraceae bacterium]